MLTLLLRVVMLSSVIALAACNTTGGKVATVDTDHSGGNSGNRSGGSC
jgi:hypothetical protein